MPIIMLTLETEKEPAAVEKSFLSIGPPWRF